MSEQNLTKMQKIILVVMAALQELVDLDLIAGPPITTPEGMALADQLRAEEGIIPTRDEITEILHQRSVESNRIINLVDHFVNGDLDEAIIKLKGEQ